MRILVSGSHTRLGETVARRLAVTHDVVALGTMPTGQNGSLRTIAGDARDRDLATAAIDGCDAVIQIADSAEIGATPLEALDLATRGTYNLITTGKSLSRFILLSSLRLFERYPVNYWITEQWAPRPTTDPNDLVPFLAEATVREASRVLPLAAIALRIGEVVGDRDPDAKLPNSKALHVDDCLAAISLALTCDLSEDGQRSGWWLFHIPGGGANPRFPIAAAGQAPFGYKPARDVTTGAVNVESRSSAPDTPRATGRSGGAARKVVIFGAGGPLAAITAGALERDHVLRLTDARSLQELVRANSPQSAGAPLPRVLPPPHEARIVDVTDSSQVAEACQDMDAIVNCTVVRPDPVEAFRVNTLGAYNIMLGAIAAGIRRIVHTGPQQVTLHDPAGYWYDFDVPDDVPSRPGANLYILTKFLGQEICRIFAQEFDLEVPTLLFSSFVDPGQPAPAPLGAFPFSVSWEDSAEAMRLALRAPDFPHPFEVFHILGDLPHGKYTNERAKRLLRWQPRDTLKPHWTRPSQ